MKMTRNERKRKANAKRLQLELAVAAAFKAAAKPSQAVTDEYPTDTYRTVRQKVTERVGYNVQRGKLHAVTIKPAEPLKGHWQDRAPVGYFGGKRLTSR